MTFSDFEIAIVYVFAAIGFILTVIRGALTIGNSIARNEVARERALAHPWSLSGIVLRLSNWLLESPKSILYWTPQSYRSIKWFIPNSQKSDTFFHLTSYTYFELLIKANTQLKVSDFMKWLIVCFGTWVVFWLVVVLLITNPSGKYVTL